MKKTILMIPSWYPTKENPYAGSFFREQALILQETYDFEIIHYMEKKVICSIFQYSIIKKKKKEENITEYELIIGISIFFKIRDRIHDIIIKAKKKNTIEGVGEYKADSYKKIRKKLIITSLKKSELPNFDFVYGASAQDVCIPSSIIAEQYHKPLILAEHGPFPWPGSSLNNLQKEAIEKADTFLAISYDKIRQVLLQNIHLHNIHYIGNFVDEEKFPLHPEKHTYKTFIIVAANSFYKNYDLFIKIMNRLYKITDVKFRVIIAGYDANKGYGENARILVEKVNNSLFSDAVELIPSVSRNEIYKIYNRSDAFVMTSIQEGMPVSALEAACCGLPVFSTRCGGVEDFTDEKIGRIFNITDYETFAMTLKNFLEGRVTFEPKQIRKKIIARYGRKAFIDNMTACFTIH